jgi:hypothetical protein
LLIVIFILSKKNKKVNSKWLEKWN